MKLILFQGRDVCANRVESVDTDQTVPLGV